MQPDHRCTCKTIDYTINWETTKNSHRSFFPDPPKSTTSKVFPGLHPQAVVIWIAFGTIFVLLIVIVVLMVYICRQQRMERPPRRSLYSRDIWSPGEDESFVNLNNSNRNNYEEALDMGQLVRKGSSFREHVHSLRKS